MKRFVVLCSIVALVSLYVPTSWATAPAVSDLPDVRLLTGGGSPKGVISEGLNSTEDDAYNLEDFVKDFDDAVGGLVLDVTDVTMVDVPPSQAPNVDPPGSTIAELDMANNVDIYGRADAGWARYTATADDGENPVSSKTAIAKYSTFAMGTPSLSAGRFFNLSADGWQLAYTWMGEDIEVEDLDSTISPPTAVDWEAYMNDIAYTFDANGNLLGIDPQYVDHGSSFSAKGWNVAISSTGGLMLSPGGVFSPGPFLIGILAINQADSSDIDATRVLVSAGMLGVDTPDTPTRDKSETLDGLTPGPIPTPVDPDTPGIDYTVPIQAGSHWGNHFLASDRLFAPAALEVVDLLTDGYLPAAADPASMKGVVAAPGVAMIATGNAIKATIAPSAGDPEAFRLFSRAFTGLEAGEVYTFAVNVATDITDATDSPNVLMAMASGLGAGSMGFYGDHLYVNDPSVAGTVLAEYQRGGDPLPFADDGWQTLSVNYTAPLTPKWFGFAAAPFDVFDAADQAVLDGITGAEGWTGELTVAKAAFSLQARSDLSSTIHVWMDNLRVYKSAYELDLGLAKTEYVTPASLTGILPAFVPQTTGDIDGSLEAYSSTGDLEADLDAIGFAFDNGGGFIDPFQRSSNGGPYPDNYEYVDGIAGVSVSTSVDHTKSAGSSNSLQIALTGTETATQRNFRAWVDTAIVALPGSGIYCVEAYISKARATNINETDRTPSYTVALNQAAPQLGFSYGAFLDQGGVPVSVGEETDAWMRLVGTGYIPDAQLARGVIQIMEAWDADVSNFDVPSYIDDIKILRVDDPAKFFDADLFDSI
jgi:hypothetical protein